jgi:hypothetical protein
VPLNGMIIEDNFSGKFTQSFHRCRVVVRTGGEYSNPAEVKFLPIIDLNPSDRHCIYSTLCFIDQQAKLLGIPNPCITFDAPLWL